MSSATAIAFALAGPRAQRLAGGGFLLPCPAPNHGKGRGDQHPSLAIIDGDHALLVRCYAGCDSRDVLDELRRRGLLDDARRPRTQRAFSPSRILTDDRQRTRSALDTWRASRSPIGTPVETYLMRRGLIVRASDSVRFHPACPFAGKYITAMIALVRNIVTNEPQAIHRTALDIAGNKVKIDGKCRLALGPTANGAIKLTNDADVTYGLGIGEGVESTASLQMLPEWRGAPVWALLSAGGIAKFPVLSGIETLVVAVDHDNPGEQAATTVTQRWHEPGRDVLLLRSSKASQDMNDIVREWVAS